MTDNPYESPRGRSDAKPSAKANKSARFVFLFLIGAVIAFGMLQLWAATAKWGW
jgi:hypothetical protein